VKPRPGDPANREMHPHGWHLADADAARPHATLSTIGRDHRAVRTSCRHSIRRPSKLITSHLLPS
jgi:hypothetical protein